MNNKERIEEIVRFYLERGVNKESVNLVYRNIVKVLLK